MICHAEVVLVPDSDDNITRVLNDISETGVLGNFSLVPDSLATEKVQGNLIISGNLG